MPSRTFVLTLSAILTLVLSSCMGTALDRNWGSSCQSALTNQQLDPKASQNLDPVYDMDGQAAAGNVGAYRKKCSAEESKAAPGATVGKPVLGVIGMPGQK